MVRAGVVGHPVEWEAGGYHEIQAQSGSYRIVDRGALAEALGLEGVSALPAVHGEWLGAALRTEQRRVPEWSESLTVGRREFVERIGGELGVRAVNRQIEATYEDVPVRI